MTGIPNLSFDYFNLSEIPTFILCNPNKEKLYSLGGISDRQYKPRFNAFSEISFRADEYVNEIYMEYYPYIVSRRLVYLVDIGYFLISDVNEDNDGIVKYKEVTCQSLEATLSSRKLTGFVSGSGIWDGEDLLSSNPIPETLTALYSEISEYMGGWTLDAYIPEAVDAKYRSFDVSDTTVYNLLISDIEEAYECVFEFDTESKLIFTYDANELTDLTDIFISHDNVIKSMQIEELTDELCTCLYVLGGGDLGINYVNPLGDNYIYNFRYFKTTEWMEQSLIDSITAWEEKVISASPTYIMDVGFFYEDHNAYWEMHDEWDIISGSARYYQTMHDASIASGEYNEDDAEMLELQRIADQFKDEADAMWTEMLVIWDQRNAHLDDIQAISDSLKFNNPDNFTPDQYTQLQPFIIQSSYVNDNIIQTDIMTSASIIEQATSLYNQAQNVLERISAPRYNIEVDSVSFLQIKEFETFASQLSLGKRITLEIKPGQYLQPILLGADIDFDNPDNFKLIFGNRLRLNDESFQFNDLINKALSAGTSISLNSQAFQNWTRDYKSQYQNLASGVNVYTENYAPGIDVNPSVKIESDPNNSIINLKSNTLQWNGVDLLIARTIGATGNTTISGSGLTNITITLFSGGEVSAMYDPDSAGLANALADASTGDVVFLPDVDISGDFYVTEGVTLVGISREESIIRGEITVEPGCLLQRLHLINQGSDELENGEDDLITIIATATNAYEEDVSGSPSKINDCDVYCYQCGTGNTTGIYLSGSSVDVEVESSVVISDSYGGDGYAFSNNGGYCKVYHSNYYAKTEIFHDV